MIFGFDFLAVLVGIFAVLFGSFKIRWRRCVLLEEDRVGALADEALRKGGY
jgi:hypothetical protein